MATRTALLNATRNTSTNMWRTPCTTTTSVRPFARYTRNYNNNAAYTTMNREWIYEHRTLVCSVAAVATAWGVWSNARHEVRAMSELRPQDTDRAYAYPMASTNKRQFGGVESLLSRFQYMNARNNNSDDSSEQQQYPQHEQLIEREFDNDDAFSLLWDIRDRVINALESNRGQARRRQLFSQQQRLAQQQLQSTQQTNNLTREFNVTTTHLTPEAEHLHAAVILRSTTPTTTATQHTQQREEKEQDVDTSSAPTDTNHDETHHQVLAHAFACCK